MSKIMNPFPINIVINDHPEVVGVSLTCKGIYINSSPGKDNVMFLYGIDFESVPFAEIAALMKLTNTDEELYVEFGKESFTVHIRMVDTSAKQIKFIVL